MVRIKNVADMWFKIKKHVCSVFCCIYKELKKNLELRDNLYVLRSTAFMCKVFEWVMESNREARMMMGKAQIP